MTIKYITEDGNEVVYEPSAKEIETKLMMGRTNELMTNSLTGLEIAYILWPIIAFASIAIGFLTPVKKGNGPNSNQV